MKIINLDRYQLLSYLPRGICAEIGVATGRLSKIIVEKNNPVEIYLVDAWKNFDLGYADENMVSEDTHEKRYQDVKEYFEDKSNVKLIRNLSVPASNQFSNSFFDWVYIDADHSYTGCLNDLKAYDSKVKDSGYIWGHDWLAGTYTKKGFDVNRAVKDFIEQQDYILSCITNEKKFASYVISKTQDSHDKLMLNIGSK